LPPRHRRDGGKLRTKVTPHAGPADEGGEGNGEDQAEQSDGMSHAKQLSTIARKFEVSLRCVFSIAR